VITEEELGIWQLDYGVDERSDYEPLSNIRITLVLLRLAYNR